MRQRSAEARWQARVEHLAGERSEHMDAATGSLLDGYMARVEAELRRDGPGAVTLEQLRAWQRWRLRRGLSIVL